MKALTSIALMLLLCSCQKEIMFPAEPETVIVKEQPQQANYREEPTQQVRLSEFGPMLWGHKQYTLTEFYCVKKDLWSTLPEWIKDDVFTVDESAGITINANLIQNPAVSFETLQKPWQLYAKDNEMKLDWVDENYDPKTYSVVAYDTEKSFTLCSKVNDSKVFITYTLIKK